MSNEKFKVKFGLAVGDTVATIDATTGNIVTTGTLDVQGGTITESTGALTISTGASNGDITLTPNGTGNVIVSSDLTVSGGNVSLNNGTSNIIDFNGFGQGAPTTTTRSAGTKIVLYPSVNATFVDYAIGATANEIWSSVKSFDAGQTFKWYGGTTEIASLGGTGNLQIDGNLDVQGGTITDSTGALQITSASNGDITLAPNGSGTVIVSSDLAVNGATSADITTTTTTASVFNTTATTLNIGGATTTTNIGKNTGSSIVNGVNRFTSPTIYGFTGGASAPSRGYMQSNGNTGSFATARNNIVMRTFPTATATSARGGLIFENARGNETTPSAVVSGDLMGELSALGYATNGYTSDYILATPGTAYFTPTETWANTGGPYPTAGTVTNAGTGYILALQPTATNLAASNAGRINVLNINPQTFASRSDAFTWANGKTGTTQTMSLDVSGNLILTGDLRVNGNDIQSSTGATALSLSAASVSTPGNFTATGTATFDSITAIDAQSNLLSTNTNAGTSVNIKTNYRTGSGGTLVVPSASNALGNFRFQSYSDTADTYVLAGSVQVTATENFSPTANGTKVLFTANKQGQNWSTGNIVVASVSPELASISSDAITLESSTGANYLVLNGTTATLTNTAGNPLPGGNISYGRQYIEAYSTVDQTNPTANAENLMSFNNTGISNGISIVTNGTTLTRITFANAGLYNLQFSAQLSQTSGGSANTFIWLKKNGATVANTAGDTRVAGNGDRIMASWNYVFSAAAGDYYELAWAASDTSVILDYIAAAGVVPAIPSVILTVVPVGA